MAKRKTLVITKKKKGKRQQQPPPVTKREVSALGQAIRTLGGALGGAGGSMFGAPGAGAMVGSSLAGALSKWLGAGDYTVGNNTVVQRSLKAASSIPSMHNDAQSIVVRHREYLGEVKSAQAFTVQQSFPLNPGASTTFPWLSGIAVRFQEYRLKGVVFHYIPTSGSAVASTNAALGSVMLQTSYRATDALPGSKVELLNEYCSNEVVPSDTMAHPIECDPKENPFNVMYVRSGTVPTGDNLMMYDLGQTHLAVSGCQTTGNVIGDLWVTYEIELKKPLVASNVTSSSLSGGSKITGTLTSAAVFSATQSTVGGTLACTVLNNTLTFPKGSVGVWQITVTCFITTGALGYGTNTLAGCKQVSLVSGDASFLSLSSTWNTATIAVQIDDPSVNATVGFGWTGAGTITSTQLLIAEQA